MQRKSVLQPAIRAAVTIMYQAPMSAKNSQVEGGALFGPKTSRNGWVDIFLVKAQLLYAVECMYGNNFLLHFQEEVKKLE